MSAVRRRHFRNRRIGAFRRQAEMAASTQEGPRERRPASDATRLVPDTTGRVGAAGDDVEHQLDRPAVRALLLDASSGHVRPASARCERAQLARECAVGDEGAVALATRPSPLMADWAAEADWPTTAGTATQLEITRLTVSLGCTLACGAGFCDETSPLGYWPEQPLV